MTILSFAPSPCGRVASKNSKKCSTVSGYRGKACLPMKPAFRNLRVKTGFALLSLLLLLATGGNTALLAQNATNTAAADVSQYPKNPASLPGKGPAATWTGLPKVWAQRHAEWARTATQD